jgi:TRAP-type C4-dicarboxylate transport system substrate-binding protein
MGSLAKFEDMLQTIQSGVADIGNHSCQYNPSQFPLHLLLDMPYNVGEDYYASLMANRETQQKEPNLRAEIEKAGIISVYPHMAGKNMMGTKKCFESIKSLKGKTIRVLGAARIKWMTEVGLNPVTMSFSDIYEAISRGTIDAAEMALDIGDVFKLYESMKCVTSTNSGNIIACGGIMNLKVYNKLPKDIQEIIQNMFEEHAIRYAKELKELESVFRDKWTKQHGVTFQSFSPEDTKMIIEAANKVTEFFIKRSEAEGHPARKVWDYYMNARKRYEGEAAKKK